MVQCVNFIIFTLKHLEDIPCVDERAIKSKMSASCKARALHWQPMQGLSNMMLWKAPLMSSLTKCTHYKHTSHSTIVMHDRKLTLRHSKIDKSIIIVDLPCSFTMRGRLPRTHTLLTTGPLAF